MNSYVKHCLALLSDMLTNRPKDLNGQVILYDDESRSKYLDIIKNQYSVSEKEMELSPECHELLKQLYGLMNEILICKLI